MAAAEKWIWDRAKIVQILRGRLCRFFAFIAAWLDEDDDFLKESPTQGR